VSLPWSTGKLAVVVARRLSFTVRASGCIAAAVPQWRNFFHMISSHCSAVQHSLQASTSQIRSAVD
jgi:hypothetical protein